MESIYARWSRFAIQSERNPPRRVTSEAEKFLEKEILKRNSRNEPLGISRQRILKSLPARFCGQLIWKDKIISNLALCFLSSACQISKNRAYATKSHRFLFLLRFVHSASFSTPLHNGGYQQLRSMLNALSFALAYAFFPPVQLV